MPYPDNGPGCPIAGCTRKRGPDMLMCRHCWSLVPTDLQHEVHTAWKQRQEGTLKGGEHYRMGWKRHEAAKLAAIEAVERSRHS